MLGLTTLQIALVALGVVFIAAGGYGLSPTFWHRRPRKEATALVGGNSAVHPARPETRPASPAAEITGSLPADDGLIEELFAEVFALRATVADLVVEVHSFRAEQQPAPTPITSARRVKAGRPGSFKSAA